MLWRAGNIRRRVCWIARKDGNMAMRVYDGPLPNAAMMTPKARVIRAPKLKFSGADIVRGAELVGPAEKLSVVKGLEFEPACLPEGNEVYYKGGKRLDNGLTAKQELFARCVAGGNTLSDSYRRSYNVSSPTATSIPTKASELMTQQKIRDRVHFLSAEIAKTARYTSERIKLHIIERLMVESHDLTSKPADRLRALELLGKIYDVSLFKEKPSDLKAEVLTVEHITHELEGKLRKVFAVGG